MKYIHTNAHRQVQTRGQATVEFALVVTVVVLLIYGILEVSRLVFINSEIDNGAREAARYAAFRVATQDDLKSVVYSKLALGDRNSVEVDGPTYLDSRGRCTFCRVSVTVRYQWTTLVPILNLGPVSLSSTATALIEVGGN